MKNRKGFTLIELLAIIVILTLIAVIITPIILGIIEDSKISAATDSAYGYKEAVGKYYASMLSQNHDFMLDGEYTIGNNGSISDGESTYNILVSGTIPNSGYLNISKGTVVSGCIQINEFAVTIEDKKVSSTTKGNCVEVPVEVVVEEFSQVTDTNPGIICGDGETEDYDNSDTCYIYSVEDLVEFSSMVNSGKNFSGKTVMLMNNLDIQNDKSYTNVNSNQFGDVNENSTTSSTLKEELTDTTGKGFKQIGNATNKFSGTFEGNTKTIKNIYINRENTDYTGLFGYNEGTIKGLKITNANIIGLGHIGIIAGHNKGTITSVIVDGNVGGYSFVGTITGYNDAGTIEGIGSGNITTTISQSNNSGGSYAGGLVGYQENGSTRGIYKSGTVTYNYNSRVGRTIGDYYSNNPGTRLTIALDTITVGGNTVSNANIDSKDGFTINNPTRKNIAVADKVIDTYVNGDNNNDGYYYDYDTNGEFTIYKLSERPLNITMQGQGTESDPYIINNYEELKQVAYILGDNGANLHYKLNTDIDLTNKNSIILGTSAYHFKGVFDGNTHTISNLTLAGHDYTGLFGYNEGTIKGLKVTNANIIGLGHIGIIAGHNKGTITSVIVDGNVGGYSFVGTITGYNDAGTIEGIGSGNITTTISQSNNSGGSYAGGLVGYQENGSTRGIYKSGTVTYNYNSRVGRTIGDYYSNNPGTRLTIALDTITVGGNTVSNANIDSKDGFTINNPTRKNIAVADKVIDTYVNGDNNNDGYYYDYDTNGEFTIYKLSERPLNITMQGQGTESDPYIINNYEELKQVAYILGDNGANLHYKLNTDIDLTNKNSIILGTSAYHFKGVFDGNTHTISNLTLVGHDYTGLFGYNEGTIKGLKITNANVTGRWQTGIIAGHNKGTITSVIVDGNVGGYSFVGTITGYNDEGTMEGIGSGNIATTISQSNNSGGSYAGGLVGYQEKGSTRGIYKSGTVTYNYNSRVGRTIGDYSSNYPGTRVTGALDTIAVGGNTVSSSSTSDKNGKSYTASDLQTLAPYQEVGLNTSSTSGEYRIELDTNHNPYLIKNTSN